MADALLAVESPNREFVAGLTGGQCPIRQLSCDVGPCGIGVDLSLVAGATRPADEVVALDGNGKVGVQLVDRQGPAEPARVVAAHGPQPARQLLQLDHVAQPVSGSKFDHASTVGDGSAPPKPAWLRFGRHGSQTDERTVTCLEDWLSGASSSG